MLGSVRCFEFEIQSSFLSSSNEMDFFVCCCCYCCCVFEKGFAVKNQKFLKFLLSVSALFALFGEISNLSLERSQVLQGFSFLRWILLALLNLQNFLILSLFDSENLSAEMNLKEFEPSKN